MPTVFVAAALLLSPLAWAAEPAETPTNTLPDGRSLQLAEREADGQVRHLLIGLIGRPPQERRDVAEISLANAERALEAEPDALAPRMIAVAALGAVARSLPFKDSLEGRYGSRSKDIIDTLLADAPEEPWVLALSGMWNLEVWRRGGFFGALVTGASIETGHEHLQQAMRLRPSDPAIPFAYAVTLLSLDAEENAKQASSLLTAAATLAIHAEGDFVAPVVRDHVQQLTGLIEANRLESAEKLALSLM